MHFIYVKSKNDRDKMLALGYVLMKEDTRNNLWVFQNRGNETFGRRSELSQAGIRFALSNTLTF